MAIQGHQPANSQSEEGDPSFQNLARSIVFLRKAHTVIQRFMLFNEVLRWSVRDFTNEGSCAEGVRFCTF